MHNMGVDSDWPVNLRSMRSACPAAWRLSLIQAIASPSLDADIQGADQSRTMEDDKMEQLITEHTAQRLASALERMADVLERGGVHAPAGADGQAYVARSIVGGIEGIKAENKRNRLKRTKR